MTRPRVLADFVVVALPGERTVLGHVRSIGISLLLLIATLVVLTIAITTGTYEIPPRELWAILTGGGETTTRFFVLDQRLPRALAAAVLGAVLALAGAIFQALSNNPLGSPDIIGFTTGAATGGLLIILMAGSSAPGGVAAGAVIGGLATAAVVWVLSIRRGLGGERLVLVGIAVGAMLASVNDYLITRADLESAEAARTWQFGSLNAVGWSHVTVPLVLAVVPILLVGLLSPTLRALEIGDDLAAALGVPVTRTRTALLVVGVALTAVAVACAGPIGFVALAAPQMARRLVGAQGTALVASAMTGALLLSVADLLAGRLLSPFQIPVGLVTGAVGGLYLAWLLVLRGKKS
ncbi:FecCD family ABC transporter permease [Millisia brevis]|uniref:FecCD family ABC transporter permease n=1 Tax=Millisia brevis TaxID=264148 RepID=UPI000B13B629|nr:iron chelate uptake ABC transporter family permease subunit [Millisia brevis]